MKITEVFVEMQTFGPQTNEIRILEVGLEICIGNTFLVISLPSQHKYFILY